MPATGSPPRRSVSETTRKPIELENYPVVTDPGSYAILVNGQATTGSLANDAAAKKSKITLNGPAAAKAPVVVNYVPVRPVVLGEAITGRLGWIGDGKKVESDLRAIRS